MADAVVSIALERLAAIAENTIREEIGLVQGVEEEVRYLSDELTGIRSVLEDAERRGYKEKSIQNWLTKLEDIAYDVEDVLDEWNFAILKLQIEGSENCVAPRPKVRFLISCSCLCFKKVATRRDIAVKIKILKERLDSVVKEKDRYAFKVDQVVGPLESGRVRSTSFLDVKEIQGREDDKDVLVTKLIHEGAGHESGPNVLSIVGTGGIGKTTVAQLVYNDDRVINSFHLRIWICVSDISDEVRIAKEIAEIVEIEKGSSAKVCGLEALLKIIRDSISGKKFLLVLDDVWTEYYAKWEPLRNSLKCGGPGSKILVTTRSEKVAIMMGTTDIHHLGQLSDEECWLLMQRIAFSGKSEEECEELYNIGKNIADKCKGLPLAAKVLGSLLRFKDTVEEWENVLNSEIWHLEEVEVDLFPHLLLSYNELSPPMKRCFSYCAIFPKDSKIDVEELVRMWMALGYLGFGGSSVDLELRGKECFNNLRMRSLFQDFSKLGHQMFCKMHDIVHDFAMFLWKGKSHNLEDVDGGLKTKERGSCKALDPSLVSQIKVYRSLFRPKELRSNLFYSLTCLKLLNLSNCGLREILGYIGNLIHLRYLDMSKNWLTVQVLQTICKLYNLQTLCLRKCGLEEIPREMGNLINLRHLDLSDNTSITELPNTICNLREMRTLDLHSCGSLSRLPEEIHKLINLRHLLNDCAYNLLQIPQGLQQLTALRTLDTFSAGRGLSKLGYLKELNQLSGSLELKIKLHDKEDVMEAQKAEMRNKKHIKRLTISFHADDDNGDDDDGEELMMEALHPPPSLQCLSIWYYQGTKFPNWITSSLNNLKELDFSGCYNCSTLPPLGKLPCLETLSLLSISELKFLDREFLGISGDIDGSTSSSAVVIGFPKLKELSFRLCSQWKEWEDITAEEAINNALLIMPCLRKLHIYDCGLTALPHRLLHKASALEYLIVNDSSHLSERYGDKNGSGRRLLSHIPNVEVIDLHPVFYYRMRGQLLSEGNIFSV